MPFSLQGHDLFALFILLGSNTFEDSERWFKLLQIHQQLGQLDTTTCCTSRCRGVSSVEAWVHANATCVHLLCERG